MLKNAFKNPSFIVLSPFFQWYSPIITFFCSWEYLWSKLSPPSKLRFPLGRSDSLIHERSYKSRHARRCQHKTIGINWCLFTSIHWITYTMPLQAQEPSAAISMGLLSHHKQPFSLKAFTHSSTPRLDNKIGNLSLFNILSLLKNSRKRYPKDLLELLLASRTIAGLWLWCSPQLNSYRIHICISKFELEVFVGQLGELKY